MQTTCVMDSRQFMKSSTTQSKPRVCSMKWRNRPVEYDSCHCFLCTVTSACSLAQAGQNTRPGVCPFRKLLRLKDWRAELMLTLNTQHMQCQQQLPWTFNMTHCCRHHFAIWACVHVVVNLNTIIFTTTQIFTSVYMCNTSTQRTELTDKCFLTKLVPPIYSPTVC